MTSVAHDAARPLGRFFVGPWQSQKTKNCQSNCQKNRKKSGQLFQVTHTTHLVHERLHLVLLILLVHVAPELLFFQPPVPPHHPFPVFQKLFLRQLGPHENVFSDAFGEYAGVDNCKKRVCEESAWGEKRRLDRKLDSGGGIGV